MRRKDQEEGIGRADHGNRPQQTTTDAAVIHPERRAAISLLPAFYVTIKRGGALRTLRNDFFQSAKKKATPTQVSRGFTGSLAHQRESDNHSPRLWLENGGDR